MELKIIKLLEAASTNTIAAANLYEPNTLIYTFRQSAGRGMGKNQWESEPDKNIAMTLVLAPMIPAGEQFAVSMAVALGCFDFISSYVDGCSIKWPNDIYVGERKIAGILIEHSIAGMKVARSICGIGVNINQTEFLSDAPNPVSLKQILGRDIDLNNAVKELANAILKRFERVCDFSVLKANFMQVLYRREGIFYWNDGMAVFQAEIEDIDCYGQLMLKNRDGEILTFGFKEIRYVGAPNSYL